MARSAKHNNSRPTSNLPKGQGMEAKSLSLLEHAHLAEMQRNLNRRLEEAKDRDLGNRESLTRQILKLVVSEDYDRAKDNLSEYLESRWQYPDFQDRASRYLKHCAELIHAIQTKRSFPGLASLSLSRQQEIHEKVIGHFEELKQNLKHVAKIERDHRLVDMRSTVWVIKASSIVVASIMGALFLVDLRSGILSSMIYMTNMAIDQASNWFVNLIM